MSWRVIYLPEVSKDYDNLDGCQRIFVRKAIQKVSANPLPSEEGGYGKALGNHSGTKLFGLLKIKLKSSGIRVVYKLIRTENEMLIVIIGARANNEVYQLAQKRTEKYGL